jgi:hypothetical protein
MKDGVHCPRCEKDIGVWPVFAAGWPTRIVCPHCRSVLAYAIPVWRTVFAAVLPLCIPLLLLSCAAARLIVGRFDRWAAGLALALWLGAWASFEYLNAIRWRRTKSLRLVRERPAKPETDSRDEGVGTDP